MTSETERSSPLVVIAALGLLVAIGMKLVGSCGWLPLLLGATALSAVLWLAGWRQRSRTRRAMRRRSTEELEDIVFAPRAWIFDYLGREHADLRTFRDLVAARDLIGLHAQWPRLLASFRRLENDSRDDFIGKEFENFDVALAELLARAGERRPADGPQPSG